MGCCGEMTELYELNILIDARIYKHSINRIKAQNEAYCDHD